MDKNAFLFWINCVGIACWPVCFWWMHRISSRQDNLLKQLHEQSKRIEQLSKAEHDLIKEVHPKVGEIHEDLQDVAAAVKENRPTN